MKKQFLGILAMLSCFAFLGGCLEDTAADKNSIPGNSITSEAPGEGAVVNFKAVKAILKGMYDQDVYSYNNVDFEVTNVIPDVQGTDYTLTWSVDVDSVKLERNGDVTKVNVDEASPVDVDYVLTATITAPNGESDTQNFRFTVKAVSQYVTATITGKPLENTPYKFHLYQSSLQQDMYFAGAMDGYYFKTTTESSEAVDIYAEYVEGSETNFNLYFKKDVVDAASGETQKDVKHYIGMRVSADGGHNNIVFDTAGPVSEFYWSDTYKTIITMLDEDRDGNKNVEFYLGNYGTLKTISGSVASQHYGKDGNNVGNLVGLVDRTTVPAADKVANTINTLGLKNSYQCDTEVDLPERGAMYPEVLISWACDSELVTIEGGKMTFANVTDATEVVLKATVTCGDISETKDVTITIASALPADGSTLTIPQALEIGKNLVTETTQKYYISGTITGFYTNGTTYGNVYIKDAEGNEILIYGLYSEDGSVRYDKMETKPVEGDFIKVYGVLTQYNGTAQFKNAWLIEHVVGEGGGEGGGDVVDPTPDANSYELSFADVANRTQGDTTIQVWEQNGIKVTNNKASSTSNVNLNYYNPVRFYKNSEVIIEFPGMTKLVVVSNKNYSDNPYVDYFTQALPVGTNFTVEDTTITIVFPAAQDSFTFTCSAGQVRLMSLTVYSGEVGGGETPDPELPPVEHEHVFVDGKCECGAEDPNYEAPVEGEWTTVVPEVGKAYIFGMTQGNLNNTVYYLAGGMDGYYMATTTDASAAIQTYIEATDGGYYFYTYVNDVKTYINMVVSGTHINGAYEATASTVYTIDETNKTLIAVVNDTDYWFGTRNDKTYTTMGPCAVSYKGFYGEFYTNSNEGGETPDPELPPIEHEHVFVDGKCECGEEDPNYVPPHEHNYEAVVTAPTCTEAGYTTYTCSCGDSYTADEVAATGHNYVDGACSVCGLAEVHEHNYEAVVTAPTCTAAGFTTYTCACGDSYTEEGEAATGHSYNSVVTDPTCGVAGYTTYTCSLCNDSYVADEVAATGEHSGYAEDYKCDACSMVVEPEADTTLTLAQAIKLADALGIGKYSTNSYYLTCEIVNIYNTQYGNANVTDADGTDYVLYGLYKDGVRYDSLEYKPVKGDTITVYGPVGSYNATSYQMKNAEITEIVAHTHDYQDVVTEPTCTADGYTTHTCSICENTYTDSEVAATGHNYVEGTCSVCGAVEGAQPVVSPLATFEFGANGTAAHVDGNDLGTSKSYTENGYTLALTDMSKVYGVAYDATGNSCIKLGTSSKAGSFSFTVDENVTEVIIKVAGYKANNGQVIINDTSYTINTTSNNGEYTEIKIDTTETKAITLSTGSTKATYRAMINSITFVGNAQ